MKILFDHGVPAPLRRSLGTHAIETAYERGWHNLKNGDLLAAAEAEGFEALLTTDQNLRYQQNLTGRRISLVVLSTTDWRRISRHTDVVARTLTALATGSLVEVSIPND